MHDLMKLPTNAPVPTKLTCGIACPDRVFMVRDLPSKDAVRIAYGSTRVSSRSPRCTR